MKIDNSRKYLYSIGNDKKLCVIDLTSKTILVHIKTSNARLRAL